MPYRGTEFFVTTGFEKKPELAPAAVDPKPPEKKAPPPVEAGGQQTTTSASANPGAGAK